VQFQFTDNLKVVGNEKEGGSARWQMIAIGLLILLSSLILCISVSAKKNIINRQCPLSRRNGANCSMLFFLSYNAHCLLTTIDAPNHTALLGDKRRTEKKSAKNNLKIIDAVNCNRIAYWRTKHRCVNKLEQGYMFHP
jgi:hypothetical protein